MKSKKSTFTVVYKEKRDEFTARTPEGAVKQFFASIGTTIPGVDRGNNFGWKGVTVFANGQKVIDPYVLPEFTWKYDKEIKQWVKA